nr:non-ribosomal peptide synthetase [Nocardia altamirensis]
MADPDIGVAGETTLVTLFEARVARTPAAAAVTFEGVTLSYGEFAARVNQLARHLISLGVGPDMLVGLGISRSIDWVVGMYAVVVAGGGCMPLDPEHPVVRSRYMLETAGVGCVLTTAQDSFDVGGSDVVVVEIDRVDVSGRAVTSVDDADRLVPLRSSNTAYVMFTSGSTGQPKGVAISHAAIVNRLAWMQAHYELTAADVVLHKSPTTFDVTAWELFLPLQIGARMVVAVPGGHRDPRYLADLIVRVGVTVAHFVPSMMAVFVAEPKAAECIGLHHVFASGETLPASTAQRLVSLTGARLHNLYGPTEAAVEATYHEVRPADTLSVPIGRPMDNTRAYVLDDRLQLVAAGVVGELYLAGVQLARGYVGRPDLTADRFVANPFSTGERLYRTGDQGKWTTDGELEYLGRNDFQVKLRGVRIEPGEIEAVLSSHPAVTRAVVTVAVRPVAEGDKQLVGYVTVDPDSVTAAAEDTVETEMVDDWQRLYDELYLDDADAAVEGDFTGWNSSYTGEPIPVADMRQWRDAAVDRIRALRPRRILEIGVGSGLLLFELAGVCEQYWATDFSEAAIRNLGRGLPGYEWADRVVLETRTAHDIAGLPREHFDTIIVNSVAQYFPSESYLRRVIDGALGLLAPGGAIFFGDIRNQTLLEEFSTAVKVVRHGDADAVQARARTAVRTEQELLLAPEYFTALARGMDEIGAVDIQLKRGRVINELTCYRYDVVLRKRPTDARSVADAPSLRFIDRDALRAALRTKDIQSLRVIGVPHEGIRRDIDTIAAVYGGSRLATRGMLPEDLYLLGHEHGYTTAVTWSPRNGYLDAVFVDAADQRPLTDVYQPREHLGAPGGYASNPSARLLGAALRQYLMDRLPDFLVPAVVMVLAEFPLSRNGKLDMLALPVPELVAREDYRAPDTVREQVLSGLFAEILGVGLIGVDDDFFDLGGHSLLVTRLVNRIRVAMGFEVPVLTVFDAPTPASLAGRLDADVSVRPALEVRPRPERIPLSFAQQRMWFLHRLEGPSATYNVPLAVRLSGRVDVDALVSALGDVVGRHESLRTVFVEFDGEPVQRVLDAANVEVPVSVSDVPDVEAEVRAAARHRFDLSAEIPLHATVFRRGGEHVLVLVIHHIAADGGSLPVLVRDLSAAYAARCDGCEPQFPGLPVQYADYALWQRELLGESTDPDSVASRQFEYWQKELAGLPEQLVLPFDRPRPKVLSFKGNVVEFTVDPGLRTAVEALARREGATASMVLQSAFAVLLHKLGVGEDIPIGSPIEGRTDAALADLVGFFVNTWVLRVDVTGGSRFVDVLDQVRGKALAAYDNQDLPFERLIELLNPVRSTAYHPLFQVMFALQNNLSHDFDLTGVDVTPMRVSTGTARFDLFLALEEQGPDGYAGAVEYSTALFDRPSIELLTERFLRVLETAVNDPAAIVGEIGVLDPVERMVVLESWNSSAHEIDGAATLASMFEAQVVRTPNASAVTFEGVVLSYREFAGRVNRLARHLISLGVGPDTLVGLALGRSIDSMVGIYAVVAAGGGYVPLDPEHPAGRSRYVLDTAHAVCLLTTSQQAFDADPDLVVVEVDRVDVSAYSTDPITNAERSAPLRASNTAYVIFTSGSTGRPKGVAVSHAAIVNRLVWMQAAHRLDETDVVLQKTPTTFDVSVWELFWPLQTGARTVLAAPGAHRDPRYLAELIAREGVTVTHFVPSMLAVFVGEPKAAECVGLRAVFASGETLPAPLAQRFCALTGARLHNLYGPTEAAVDVTYHEVVAADVVSVPIGRPVFNTRAYVLDDRLGVVPVAVAGELYLAGAQLARAYEGRPDLTAERFVANPFATGERMYRTGDRVSWNRDGELEYLGRTDFQVKLRGQRIEPGEIVAALVAQTVVAQAVVVVRSDEHIGDQLVAYLVAETGCVIDTEAVYDHLVEELPPYMVPAVLMVLDNVPLSRNGKLDTRALPAPEFVGRGYRAPGSWQEQVLAGLFGEILGARGVGVDDNFFDLGGHSLLVTRLVSKIRTAMGFEVPVLTVFDAPTPALLARRLDAGISVRPALQVRQRPERVPLSFAQQRMWFLHRLEGPSATYNMPLAVRLSGQVNVEALTSAIEDVIERHESLRTVFVEFDGFPTQRVLNIADVEVPVVVSDVDDLGEAIIAAARYRFDLSAEIPLRASVFRHDNGLVLVLVVHHIASDGASLSALARDLSAAYTARCEGCAPDWPELPVQYVDYALWQRELLGESTDPDSVASRQFEYWQKELTGLPAQLVLPFDRPRPKVLSFKGNVVEFTVDGELRSAVDGVARSRSATASMVLQTVFALTLHQLGAGEDIPIGSPIEGRTDAALADLVGFFVNTWVLRVDVTGGSRFVDVLDQVRGKALAAYGNQDLPFERLIELLNPVRSTAYHPLFQVMFALQNNHSPEFGLPGIDVAPMSVSTDTSRFDLLLTLTEVDSGYSGVIEYATDLFDHRTVESLIERFVRVLETMVHDPTTIVGDSELQIDHPPIDPTPLRGSRPRRSPYREPRTSRERALAGLFAEVLGMDAIGADDGFFDLGGHSLLATQLVSKIRVVMGFEVPILTVFDAPTPALLADQLDAEVSVRPALTARSRPAQVPLSFAQRRIWFLQRLEGSSATYNVPLAIGLSAQIDIEALTSAIGDVVGRHESLRTVFVESEGEPAQQVLEAADIAVEVSDIDEPAVAIAAAARHRFDLATEIPLQASIFHSRKGSALVLVLHHIACDGGSLAPLARDLSAAYAARCAGRAPDWQALPVQYADYALWQRELLGDQADPESLAARQFDYWRKELADLPEQLPLPFDRPRPKVSSFRGDSAEFTVDAELRSAIEELARRRGVTASMLLQTVFAIVLHKVGAGDDIPIGSPIAGRTDAALADLVGFFVNTWVLRVGFAGNSRFEDLLDQVRGKALAAYGHQDLPFERLIELLNPARSTAYHPLFQVTFALQNNLSHEFALPDAVPIPVSTGTAKMDLFLSLEEQPDGGYAGAIEYATDLFDRHTIDQFIERFRRVLEMVVHYPAIAVSDLGVLLPGERRQLLAEWNDTTATPPVTALPDLFTAQAAATPDTTAVICGDVELTYAELGDRVDRLAHWLIAQGVGIEDTVAVHLPRSADTLVALLGVLKAGAAYLPLDTEYPESRIRYMVEHAKPTTVLDSSAMSAAQDHPADAQPFPAIAPDNAAYIVYTSGSTGEPKGIVGTHAGLVNCLAWFHALFPWTPGEVTCAKTSVSFGDSLTEILRPLTRGGTVVVAEQIRDLVELVTLIERHQVRRLGLVPSLLAALIADDLLPRAAACRVWISSGEPLPVSVAEGFSAQLPDSVLVNLYGSSEISADSTWAEVGTMPHADEISVPIGRPLDNTRVYVLDNALHPVPRGVVGELYVAGVGLARGYLNRRALTAARFVADPFAVDPGGRLYRTGDLVRWRADGHLVHLGRADNQMKIRGFRIEPGEVESALAAHPAVARAVVAARETNAGHQLVGYLVPADPGVAVDVSEVRQLVASRLPDYMVPTALTILEELPLNPNGKVDRGALPEPEFTGAAYQPPRTPREELLCAVFAEVLAVDQVGLDDSFFDLGGHSLLVVRLVRRISERLGVEIELKAIFQERTVRDIARRLGATTT